MTSVSFLQFCCCASRILQFFYVPTHQRGECSFLFSAQAVLLFPFSVLISLCCCCCRELFTSPWCPPLASLLHPVSGWNRRLVLLGWDEVLEFVQMLRFSPSALLRAFHSSQRCILVFSVKERVMVMLKKVYLFMEVKWCLMHVFWGSLAAAWLLHNPAVQIDEIAASVWLARMPACLFWQLL